jgi:hypothetical protein
MRNDITKCDNCMHDLTESHGITNYYLVLSMDRSKDVSTVTYGIFIYPLLERTHHFCGFGCLKKWLDKPMEEK